MSARRSLLEVRRTWLGHQGKTGFDPKTTLNEAPPGDIFCGPDQPERAFSRLAVQNFLRVLVLRLEISNGRGVSRR
jgi:hypothetical protein